MARRRSVKNFQAEIVVKIIVVEREYGCGGGQIAAKLADRLGWKLWDQLLTCEIARLADCNQADVRCREERVDPLYYRLFKSIMRGSFEGSLNVHRLKLLDADSIFHITERVVQQAASAGNCVIVGRGAQHFLRDRDDTLRVFLFAPKKDKVTRLMAEGMSRTDAEESADSVDQDRAEFIQKYFQMEWPNRSLYHVMLNTSAGEETVIQTILNLKKALERQTE